MNNPPGGNQNFSRVEISGRAKGPDPRIYGRLVEQFTALSSAPIDVSYETLRELPGFRVLHTREQGQATALAFERGELLVQTRSADNTETWQVLDEHGLRAEKAEPPALVRRDPEIERWPVFSVEDRWIARPGTGPLAGRRVWPGTRRKDDLRGLWIASDETEPELLARGLFAQSVVTPDGEWLVVAKAGGTDWCFPNGVVRIHIADRREEAVGLPAADNFNPVAWLPAQRKVLLYRAKDGVGRDGEKPVGPRKPEFHLLDPATGQLTKVTGEFRALFQESWRGLQPAGEAGKVWVALPSAPDEAPGTIVARYDTRRFSLLPRLKIPGVTFSSPDMWVDEPDHSMVFIVNGDVLRLSLPR